MDKEHLLTSFLENDIYFSKREVLYRLPLDVPIGRFWPELLDRRKSSAILLPLHDASGMPYWYVQTKCMVAASEKLCEAALGNQSEFDPYRMQMTGAMTEEAFFTSYVEGSQMSLQEAMDFLQRGTAPENILEQMILNNRNAWSIMIDSLYRPLDETFIRTLAYTLTQEMDACAEDYRTTDTHMIKAMAGEPYRVPPAFSLPDRMKEYYKYLCLWDIHPLIKSAVGQAYLLVARPFPEGNERLSRMISAAVLLRCGYDFMRDISISSAIARETHHYYKSMCNILRDENGGDLTYFIEYFLTLLCKALEYKRYHNQRNAEEEHDEGLERERKLALQPLEWQEPQAVEIASITDPADDGPTMPQSEPAPQEADLPVAQGADAKNEGCDDIGSSERDPESPAPKISAYIQAIKKRLEKSPNPKIKCYPEMMRRFLESGLVKFTVNQASDILDIPRPNIYRMFAYLYKLGYLDKHKQPKPHCDIYYIRLPEEELLVDADVSDDSSALEHEAAMSTQELEAADVDSYLTQIQNSGCIRAQDLDCLASMAKSGVTCFTKVEWQNASGMSWGQTNKAVDSLVRYRLLQSANPNVLCSKYALSIEGASHTIQNEQAVIQRMHNLLSQSHDAHNDHIITSLLEMIDRGQFGFAASEWMTCLHLTKSSFQTDMRIANNLGLIQYCGPYGAKHESYYHIRTNGACEFVRLDNMTVLQREILTTINRSFHQETFTARMLSAILDVPPHTLYYHLTNLSEKGILIVDTGNDNGAKVYRIGITPDEHPECFEL